VCAILLNGFSVNKSQQHPQANLLVMTRLN
jgi:hypothetical protein